MLEIAEPASRRDFIISCAFGAREFLRDHLIEVEIICKFWGEHLGMRPLDLATFSTAGLLHDLGKCVIPDSVLRKGDALMTAEQAIITEHVEIGARLIEGYVDARVVGIVMQHHERIDGHGYPNGRRGREIDPLARRLAIVDAFSAMTEDRVYQQTRTKWQAIAELKRCAGMQVDSEFVQEFITWISR